MICPNCNTPNDELANVCINCGQPLDTEETITSEQDRNAKLEEIQSRRLKKKKIQKRNRIIAICILIALILGALAYGVYTLRDNFFADGGDNLVISSPTPTLDTATEEEIIRIFKQLTEDFGKTVIVVTHSNAVSKFSDLRLKLENGQLRLMGENE